MTNKSNMIRITTDDVFWNIQVRINPEDRDPRDYPIIRLVWGFNDSHHVDTKPDMAGFLINELTKAINKTKI